MRKTITTTLQIMFMGVAGLALSACAQLSGSPEGQTAPPAQAQQKSSASQPMQAASAPKPAYDFSQQQLQKFAAAHARVNQIVGAARQKMHKAGGAQAQARIRRQAQQAIVTAIKDTGLSIRTYKHIGRAAQANPQLAQTIQQLQ